MHSAWHWAPQTENTYTHTVWHNVTRILTLFSFWYIIKLPFHDTQYYCRHQDSTRCNHVDAKYTSAIVGREPQTVISCLCYHSSKHRLHTTTVISAGMGSRQFCRGIGRGEAAMSLTEVRQGKARQRQRARGRGEAD